MARAITDWRALYPISGTRSELIPPPGWRAPKDWATYPRPIDELQETENLGMAPSESILRILDMQHGQRGAWFTRVLSDGGPSVSALKTSEAGV